jgi:outer membrane lipoprotein SlyB
MIAAAVACALAGCASSTDSGDSWSRSYLSPQDVVFDAVVDVLEDSGYLVEADSDAGRISAKPARGNRGLSPSLAVRVVVKAGRTRVDVQTRSGVNDAMTRGQQIETTIAEFFHELELRLHGFKD